MIEFSKNPMRGAAERFIDGKLQSGIVSFSMTDLTRSTGLSVIAARNQLLRLGDQVIRITPRQEFFLIVTAQYRVFGAPPVELWLDDYFAWLQRPYYLALQSAAAVHGSSPQAIQETQVITDMPMRDILLNRIRLHFFMKKSLSRIQVQQMPNAPAPLRVSTPETTAFDLVRYAGSIGGIERIAETIQPMIKQMKPSSLREVLNVEDEIATAQRLGYILSTAGKKSLARVVADWLPHYVKIVPLALGVAADRGMPTDKTYGLILNIHGI